MTDHDRELWIAKCGEILAAALVEIRTLSFEEGHSKQINDLADITHNIPRFMVGRDESVPKFLRESFVEYALKYHPDTDPAFSRYVWILDMDEAAFADRFQRTTWDWPEPVTAG